MADHRHKRVTNARRKLPRAVIVSAPLAAAATIATVSAGVLMGTPVNASLLADAGSSLSTVLPGSPSVSLAVTPSGSPAANAGRSPEVSRDKARTQLAQRRYILRTQSRYESRIAREATAKAVRDADARLWVTTDLNIWDASDRQAANLGEIEAGDKVLVTGREADGRSEVVIDGNARWVTSGYFSDEEPVVGIGGACTNGSSVASGVSPNIVKVHEAVCAAFPEITTYGTFRGDGEHAQGIAVDIMVSGSRGWQVADFVRENYSALGVSYVIYSQNIWSVERSGEGWRGMSDRGSVTANHYDHVHVTTY